MDTNVQFYEKISHLQNAQHDRESQRIELERQLNSYVKSDKRIAKLKAVRLQSYWNKICEDEKRSQWRNEQLLKDFERVEMHMADLHSRTEKLRDMKRRYEEYVERVYPNWKEKIMHFQRLKKHQEEQDRVRDLQQMEERERAARMPQTYTAVPERHMQQAMQQQQYPGTSQQQHPGTQGYQPPEYGQQHLHPMQITVDPELQTTNGAGSSNTLQTVSTLPSNTFGSAQATSTPQTSVFQHKPSPEMQRKQFSRPDPVVEQEEPLSSHRALSQQHQQRLGVSPRAKSSTHTDSPSTPTTQITQKQVQSFMTEAERDIEEREYSYRSAPRSHSPRTPRQTSAKQSHHSAPIAVDQDRTDDQDVSGWASDEDLPLSMQDTPRGGPMPIETAPKVTNQSPRRESPRGKESFKAHSSGGNGDGITKVKSAENAQGMNKSMDSELGETEKSIYLQPEVTLDGLYNLLTAIEEDIEAGKATKLYTSEAPAQSVIKDIIDNANKGSVVSCNTTASLSMVILDQLPLVVYNQKNQCILPDTLLRKPPTFLTENSVRSQLDVTVQPFWSKLYDHFVMLLKNKAMKPQEITQIFAEHLIHKDSPYESKAADMLQKLLEDVNPHDVTSPHSTDTFSNTPRPVHVLTKAQEEDAEENDDAFFEQEVPRHQITGNVTSGTGALIGGMSTAGGLTQSAAYRSMLTSTQSTAKSHISYEDSDEDIEEILIPQKTPEPAATSSGIISPAEKAPDQRALSPDLSAASLPPSTISEVRPGTALGTRPISALGDTAKSGTLSYGSTKKSKAFYQDSDTDEDIQVPGVGDDQDKDEFDFYD